MSLLSTAISPITLIITLYELALPQDQADQRGQREHVQGPDSRARPRTCQQSGKMSFIC